MTPPKLTTEEKPLTKEFIPDDYEQQRSNFLPEVDATDATGKPVNQKSVADLLINS